MIKRIDDIGRILIPKEIREELNLYNCSLRFKVKNRAIIIEKVFEDEEEIRQEIEKLERLLFEKQKELLHKKIFKQ